MSAIMSILDFRPAFPLPAKEYLPDYNAIRLQNQTLNLKTEAYGSIFVPRITKRPRFRVSTGSRAKRPRHPRTAGRTAVRIQPFMPSRQQRQIGIPARSWHDDPSGDGILLEPPQG